MSDNSISHHRFADCLWIRCEGRGCFVNSPVLKCLAENYLSEETNTIVVDLEMCSGVDSTFMGTLAGLARKSMALGGSIQIASPSPRTRDAMEGLGLDMLVDIDPQGVAWQNELEARRAELNSDCECHRGTDPGPISELDRTRHVLEAHNTLRSMNHKNDETFGYVCETLEEDLMRQTSEEE